MIQTIQGRDGKIHLLELGFLITKFNRKREKRKEKIPNFPCKDFLSKLSFNVEIQVKCFNPYSYNLSYFFEAILL